MNKYKGKMDYRAWWYCKRRNIENIIPLKKTCMILDKSAEIRIKKALYLGENSIVPNGRSTILRMDKGSKLIVENEFRVYYGGDIICFPNSCLELGDGFFNSNVKIRCMKHISIGKEVFISHNVTIMDSDAHHLEDRPVNTIPITIGNHVWIGSNVIILKGVHIGDGAVIGAGSVVTRDVPANTLAVGNPAQIVRANIKWH